MRARIFGCLQEREREKGGGGGGGGALAVLLILSFLFHLDDQGQCQTVDMYTHFLYYEALCGSRLSRPSEGGEGGGGGRRGGGRERERERERDVLRIPSFLFHADRLGQ